MLKMKQALTFSNIILATTVILITVYAIIFSSAIMWVIWLSTLLGMLSSKTNTEGKWITFIFDILSYAIYIYVCIAEKYYGELILSVIIITIHMFSLFEWKKTKHKTML